MLLNYHAFYFFKFKNVCRIFCRQRGSNDSQWCNYWSRFASGNHIQTINCTNKAINVIYLIVLLE